MTSVEPTGRSPSLCATRIEAGVLRVDQADDLRLVHPREGKLQSSPRRLGGIAPAPEGAAQHPAELEAGPPLRIPKANAANEDARRAFLGGPQAVAAQRPVTDHQRQVTPRQGPKQRLAVADVAHD